MAKSDATLLDEIERDAADSSKPLADVLRKCLMLGGRTKSTKLMDWATKELQGYKPEDELPAYRNVDAIIAIDGISGRLRITQQQITPHQLPDGIRDHIDQAVPLAKGVGEIEAMANRASEKGLKVSLPLGPDVARLMTHELNDPFQQVDSVYWMVSEMVIRGALDQIRTILTQLVAEMRIASPSGTGTPTAESADQAINVVVNGGKRTVVSVNASRSDTGDAASTMAGSDSTETGFWTRSRKIGAFVVGVATVMGAVFALAQVQGWTLF